MNIGTNLFTEEKISEWIKIKPMPYYKGIESRLLIYSKFDNIESFKKGIRIYEQEMPFVDSCEEYLAPPVYNYDYFFIYVIENETVKKGIINRNGDVIAYDNFDDAFLFPKSIIVLHKDNKLGYINGLTNLGTDIKYCRLDFSPIMIKDVSKKLAVIACIESGWDDCYGILDYDGNIVVPLKYDEVNVGHSSIYVRLGEKETNVPIAQLNNGTDIKLHPARIKNRFPHVDDFDDGEMDYIRNNGGDWIDD